MIRATLNSRVLVRLDLLCTWPVVLIAGFLQTAAFAPGGHWPLQILSLALLAHASWDATPARAARLGALFGTAWMGSGLWWLYISLHDFGHLPAPLAGLAVFVLALFLALFYAAGMALAAALRGRARPALHALIWSSAW
ncbi:MAG TPA: hypothetical protein VGE47_17555, partial [Burkholderiaceae bacterium]